jgi:hypothetical protein
MLSKKYAERFAELIKMGVPQNTADFAAQILKNLPEKEWAIFAKLDNHPVEVQIWNQETKTNIDISIG